MATPSSSVTSASPPMSFLQPTSLASTASSAMLVDSSEKEQRKQAVQKFIARAEISMVTRALRARLSYASYKATHNIPHVPLRDLEAQGLSQQSFSSSRSQTLKRKSSGTTANYYNNPNTQGGGSASSKLATRRGSMAPPPVAPYPSSTRHVSNLSASGLIKGASTVSHNLYTSLLAPPPAKQARTIHNANDPPLAPPKRPTAVSARARKVADSRSARNTSENSRANAKSKRGDPKARVASKDRKGKQKDRSESQPVIGSREETDVDLKAAATLTSLLFHTRPGASPRPSNAGSASLPAYTHGSPRASTSAPVSADNSFAVAMPTQQQQNSMSASSTPPPLAGVTRLERASTHPDVAATTPKLKSLGALRPHEATNDSEAADLMLFLATSPSPARPTAANNRDARDQAAFRALTGGNGSLRAKGRVLFPPNDGSTGEPSSRPLIRHNDSFNASVSSIGSHLGSVANLENSNTRSNSPTLIPGLLAPGSPQSKAHGQDSAYPTSPTPWHSTLQAPPTPGNLPFNFNDFINVSPSPAAPARNGSGGPLKSSLRADVGRKLFEEEQQRHLKDTPLMGMSIGKTSSFGEELGSGDRSTRGGALGLGAGIDLVQI